MTVHATYTTAQWVKAYLTIWQGPYSFTTRELDVLCLIAERQLHLQSTVLDPALSAELLLSPTSRSEMRDSLHISINHFQNTLASLKEKGAIAQDSGGNYYLSKQLIPRPSITFSYTIHD